MDITKLCASKGKTKILKKLAKKRGWKIINLKLARVKPKDLRSKTWI